MNRALKIVVTITVLCLLGFAALHTGFARHAFFELFAYVKGVDVLGPTVVREPPVDSPYQLWLADARNEIPVHETLALANVGSVELQPWSRLGSGVSGLYLHFADYQVTDGRLLEIPAGASTVTLRALYEQCLYVIRGSGHTLVQNGDTAPTQVPWKTGDLFCIPLNVGHRHFGDGDFPARLLIVTAFPLMLNMLADEGFLHGTEYDFEIRYDGDPAYFDASRRTKKPMSVLTNFAEGVARIPLEPLDYRGEGNVTIGFDMAGNTMLDMHLSEMPPRMYKKAHRHTSDAFILILSGEGFSVTWPEGRYDKRERVDWEPGTLFAPPTYWYHQHLNTGDSPARYLAISTPVLVRNLGLRFIDQLEVDIEAIKREWEAALEQAR